MIDYNRPMESLPADRVTTLEAVARRIVPEVAALDAAGQERFRAIIDQALTDRPPAMRRQFGVFLGLIHNAPRLRFGRAFEDLGGERQERVLRWLQDCPVSLLRKGFWGLKALVFMGYYGQPELWSEIGYAPLHDAREKLHG